MNIPALTMIIFITLHNLIQNHLDLIRIYKDCVQILLKLINLCNSKLREFDFFSHKMLLRYKKQEAFGTTIGGFVSLVICICFSTLFFYLTKQAIQRNTLIYQEATLYKDFQLPTILQVNPQSNFMFGIGIDGMNLNDPNKYFQIELESKTYMRDVYDLKRQPPINEVLQPCKIQRWQKFGENITKRFKYLRMHQWLCPPATSSYTLNGKYSSQIFNFLKIVVRQCNSLTSTCRSQTQIEDLLAKNDKFSLNFYYINPVINLQKGQPISYELKDNNYLYFDTTTTSQGNLYFKTYLIATDTSIFPNNDINIKAGFFAEQIQDRYSYSLKSSSNQYLKLYVRQSQQIKSAQRQYRKLDDVYSFIGGLITIVVSLFFLLEWYSKFSYQLALGDDIFTDDNGNSFGSFNFGIVRFFGYLIYLFFLNIWGWKMNWQIMKKYDRCRKECQKQISFNFLFQRIAVLENMCNLLWSDEIRSYIRRNKKQTISQARNFRNKYQVSKMIYHSLQKKGNWVIVQQQEIKQREAAFIKDKDEQQKWKTPSKKKAIQELIRLHNQRLQKIPPKLKQMVQDILEELRHRPGNSPIVGQFDAIPKKRQIEQLRQQQGSQQDILYFEEHLQY